LITQDRIRQILDELPDREGRSCLAPYLELIFEMRRRKYSYREIARLLAERCGLKISHSTIHDFVKRHSHEVSGCGSADTSMQPNEDCRKVDHGEDVRERIAALKRRPALSSRDETRFRYDSDEPLRFDEQS